MRSAGTTFLPCATPPGLASASLHDVHGAKPSRMTMMDSPGPVTFRPHSAHWGAFLAGWEGDRLVVKPHPDDPDPNPLIENFPDALRHPARVARPMVRRGWLERGPGPDERRGRDEFVAMDLDRVLDLLAVELLRVRDTRGP